jgi:hypothetical protein
MFKEELEALTEVEALCYEYSKDGMTRFEIKQKLLKDHGLDVSVKDAMYRARRKLNMDGNSGLFDLANNMRLNPGNINNAWLKTKEGTIQVNFKSIQETEAQENFLDMVKAAFSEEPKNYHYKASPLILGPDSNLLTKYVVADIHMGLAASAEISGEDYNVEIAEKVVLDSMKVLVESSQCSSRAIILSIGDYFHANDSTKMTPKSKHILDVDGFFYDIAVAGVRCLRKMVEMALEKHETVEVVSLPGNHDPDQAHWLAIALQERYSHEPRVVVHKTPGKWFHTTHGRNLLCAHHGDGVTLNRMAATIPELYRKIWGETDWTFLDTGHVHHSQEIEIGGVLCRTYRTPAAKDAYATGSAYTSKRSMTAHVYHKTNGEVNAHTVNILNNEVLR